MKLCLLFRWRTRTLIFSITFCSGRLKELKLSWTSPPFSRSGRWPSRVMYWKYTHIYIYICIKICIHINSLRNILHHLPMGVEWWISLHSAGPAGVIIPAQMKDSKSDTSLVSSSSSSLIRLYSEVTTGSASLVPYMTFLTLGHWCCLHGLKYLYKIFMTQYFALYTFSRDWMSSIVDVFADVSMELIVCCVPVGLE